MIPLIVRFKSVSLEALHDSRRQVVGAVNFGLNYSVVLNRDHLGEASAVSCYRV